MNIGFIGCVTSSKLALLRLLELKSEGINIAAVMTKEQSSFNADHEDLAPICKVNSIPYLYHDKSSDNSLAFFREHEVDVIYCFGWSFLLKGELLSLPQKGVIGFHPAKLPMNRGRHPIIWALALGLKETASTFFIMDEGADSGPIISQKLLPIEYEDDAASLYNKIMDLALEQIQEFSFQLRDNTQSARVQDNSKASYWRKRGRPDGLVDWRMCSVDIYNLVRALREPYPGAEFKVDDNEYKIIRVSECHDVIEENAEPGKILRVDGLRALVKCGGRSAIWLEEHNYTGCFSVGEYL